MSLRIKDLAHAVAEAKRFIEIADLVDQMAGQQVFPNGRNGELQSWYKSGQYIAAAKRASMDLSRALVKVRR